MSRFPRPGRTPRPRPVPTAGPTPSPTPGPGTTFTLTTNIETVPATGVLPANSTVNGVINGATGTTFQTGDIINGNATSEVNVVIASDFANLVDINTAKSVNLRNVSGAASTLTNAILWDNVQTVSSTNSLNGVSLTNGAIASTYALVNPLIDSGAGLSVGFRAADLVGTATTAQFSISGAGVSSNPAAPVAATLAILNNSTGSTATGVEIASIATTGNNLFTFNGGTNLSRLNLTGSGNNDLTFAAGGITTAPKTINLSGASGANVINLGSNVSTSDTYVGGTGVDVLRINPGNLGAVGLNVSGFETLRLAGGTTAGTLGFATAPNFGQLRIDGVATAGATYTLLNAGTLSNIALSGNGAANVAFNALTAATTGTVNINVSNLSAAGAGTNATYTSGNYLLNGATSINLNVANSAANTANFIDTVVVSNALTSFTASGSGALGAAGTTDPFDNSFFITSGITTGTGGPLQTVNLSGLTNTGAVSFIAIGNETITSTVVTATAGGTTLYTGVESSTDVLTFNGGAGVDSYNASSSANSANRFVGFINFNGGAGADVLLGGTNTVVANGGDDGDQLTGGTVIDTLRGDAGNDTIAGLAGRDVVTGGDGVDAFRYNQSLSTDIDTITDFAFGATGDNIGYGAGSAGFTATAPAAATAGVQLSNGTGAILAASNDAVIATFNGGAGITAGTSTNFIQLTNVSATNFQDAIGANGVDFGAGTLGGTVAVAAVYFDSVNQQAVFGFINNTAGTTGDTLNSSDLFTEVARATTTSTAFLTLGTANVDFF